MDSPIRGGEYVFDNDTDEATTQLRLLANILDPHSTDVLGRLQPQSGWRCWDVGAGAGTISTWLADRVAPTGAVLATDIKPQPIPARLNVVVGEHDVRTDPLPGSFDLIHARLVLMHLPEREAVLRRLVDALDPGGILVVSDWDLTNPDYLIRAPHAEAEAAFRSFHRTLLSVCEAAGIDITWARRSAKALLDLGLDGVNGVGVVNTWLGGSAGCRLHRSNSLQLEAALVAAGMTHGELETLRSAMLDRHTALWSFQLFTTIARRPSD